MYIFINHVCVCTCMCMIFWNRHRWRSQSAPPINSPPLSLRKNSSQEQELTIRLSTLRRLPFGPQLCEFPFELVICSHPRGRRTRSCCCRYTWMLPLRLSCYRVIVVRPTSSVLGTHPTGANWMRISFGQRGINHGSRSLRS